MASLTNALLATDIEIKVSSTQGFPANGVIQIENELIRYNAINANTLFNCIRGYHYTASTYHAQAIPVKVSTDHIITTKQFAETYQNNKVSWYWPKKQCYAQGRITGKVMPDPYSGEDMLVIDILTPNYGALTKWTRPSEITLIKDEPLPLPG